MNEYSLGCLTRLLAYLPGRTNQFKSSRNWEGIPLNVHEETLSVQKSMTAPWRRVGRVLTPLSDNAAELLTCHYPPSQKIKKDARYIVNVAEQKAKARAGNPSSGVYVSSLVRLGAQDPWLTCASTSSSGALKEVVPLLSRKNPASMTEKMLQDYAGRW